jgi:hypothetical protein
MQNSHKGGTHDIYQAIGNKITDDNVVMDFIDSTLSKNYIEKR